MRNVIAVLLFGSFIVAYGCKEERQQAEEAMKLAEQAKAMAEAAAKEAQKEAAKAAVEAGKAGDAAADGAEGQPKDLNEALAKMKSAIEKNAPQVDPVDFRKLKKMLPEKVAGLERKKAQGEKAGAMGVKVSNAMGQYEGAEGARLKIKLIDMGSMKGFAAMAATGWAMAEIDRESDDGWEKTTKYKGFKAFEKYNTKRKQGETKLIVANRFIVEISGRKVTWDQIKDARDEIPFSDLEDLKNEGVKDTK